MIQVNITATNFTVVSSSTTQNFTITSDNTIFTITNTVSPNITIINTSTNLMFSADGSVNTDPVFNTITANTGTFTKLIASTGTFTSLTTQNFNLNGLQYPSNRGSYGQVLFTNGTSFANWVNLGDLVFWSLNSDLLTNGYNIVSGSNSTPLTISAGSNESILLDPNNNRIFLQAGEAYINLADITTIQAETIRLRGKIEGNGSKDLNLTRLLDLYQGILFPDGSVLTTANITTNTNTGTSIVPIATDSRLGVVKIGSGLSIQENGNLSVNYGSGLATTNEGVLYVTSTYTLPAASSSVRGGVRIGTGITITNGDVINADYTTATIGIVSLTQDMDTNAYKVWLDSDHLRYLGFGNGVAGIIYGGESIGIGTQYIRINHGTAINLEAPYINLGTGGGITRIGTNSTSTLYVQRIYNYAGTYAPTFPAGVQFGDNSVQVTAFQTSTLYQQYIDFQNPQDP
jgi:hypothetical protein